MVEKGGTNIGRGRSINISTGGVGGGLRCGFSGLGLGGGSSFSGLGGFSRGGSLGISTEVGINRGSAIAGGIESAATSVSPFSGRRTGVEDRKSIEAAGSGGGSASQFQSMKPGEPASVMFVDEPPSPSGDDEEKRKRRLEELSSELAALVRNR